LINPILPSEFDKQDRVFFADNVNPSFEVEVKSLDYGPASIEGYYDETLAAPFVVKRVVDAGRRGFDAVIINCFMDPGLDAAREAVEIPVVGAGESAICLALMVGDSFSIIDPGPRNYVSYAPTRQVRRMGVENRFVSVRGAGVPVLEITKDLDKTTERIRLEVLKAVEEDGAEVVVLGCTGLAGLAPKVQAKLGVPVIDPALAALRMAEVLVQLKLPTSRASYPESPEKPRKLPF